MADYRIFSADSHFVEPATMWAERMDAKFRDRAPHTIQGHDGKEGEFFACENINPAPVSGFFGSGKTAEELPEHFKQGFSAAPKSVWDPAERLKEQDADGVSGEVLYPSMGMLLFGLDDARPQTPKKDPDVLALLLARHFDACVALHLDHGAVVVFHRGMAATRHHDVAALKLQSGVQILRETRADHGQVAAVTRQLGYGGWVGSPHCGARQQECNCDEQLP